MDPEQYHNILNYIQSQILPSILTNTQQKNSFKNLCKNFIIKNNFLYKIDKQKKNNLLRVIRKFETEAILYIMHNDLTEGHLSIEAMFSKIRSRYYWLQMYKLIREYVKTCDSCQ